MISRFGDGARLHVFDALLSTQNAARGFIEAHGTNAVRHAFYTENQTGGRGRVGKSWYAPPGANVSLSVIVPPVPDAHRWRLTFAVGVAVVLALRRFVPEGFVHLRFPNDVLIRGKKVAGILVEIADLGLPIVGIGVNVCGDTGAMPPDVAVRATTIEQETNTVTSLADVREAILTSLAVVWEIWFHDNDFAAVLALWHDFHDPDARRTFTIRGEPVSCRVLGVTETGTVTLELPDGSHDTLPVAHILL